jgi:hypothetical protein
MRLDPCRKVSVLLAVALFTLVPQASAPAVQTVLPPGARPHGYTLSDMALATAPFTLSSNDETLLPSTPFQVLYYDPSTLAFTPEGGGFLGTASNTFTVTVGTPFYVPLWLETPTVLGGFPTSPAAAKSYFFDSDQLGAEGFEVIVDGASTPIGAAFLAGPLTVSFGGQDVEFLTLAAFLHPLPPGTHTVTIRGGLFGDLVSAAYGIDFIREDITYTVEVVRP